MKALRSSGKRFIGGLLVCGCLALPALAPVAAHAGSLTSVTAAGGTTMGTMHKRNPCQSIQAQIDNLSPADFLNMQEYLAAMRSLLAQLHACELRH
jgi:hypothetical protein